MAKVGMFLETNFPPDPRVQNEAMSLIESGHSVYLFNLDYSRKKSTHEVYNGIQVYRYPVGRLVYKLSALVYTFPFYQWLISSKVRDFLGKIELDVVHVHDMILAETVMRVNRGRLPVVLDLHENRPAIMKHYHHTNRFPGNLLINLKEWEKKQDELIDRADQVITVTEEARQHYLERVSKPARQFTVVPNTVNLEAFLGYEIRKEILDKFKESFNLLYVGDTGIRRGLMTVIDALPQMKKSIPNIRVIIVGSSSADDQLFRRAEELDVLQHVSFEGWQDMSLFPSYMKVAHICLSPIHRNLHHDTTFANKIFQYMAMGKAQVVSDCPPQARVVRDLEVGLVHQSQDALDFARCIEHLYRDADLRAQMEERSIKYSRERWNWAETGKGLVELYHSFEQEGR